MTALAWITGILLLVGFGMAGMAKITKQQMVVDSAEHLGFTPSQYQLIGVAEVAGAAGVLIGLLVDSLSWLGLLAAAGLILLTIGALYFHVRANDKLKDMMPAAVLMVAAVVHLVAVA